MITNQFSDFKHTNFQISTPTPFEVYPMLVAIQMACSLQYSLIEDIYNRALNMNTYGIENMFYGFVKMGFKNPTMCVYIVSAV